MFSVCEMEKLRLEGLKKDGKATFYFRTAPFGFRTTCEMALGVRNYFTDPSGFCTACEMVLGVLNFLHALRKFRRVCEMSSYGVLFSLGVQNWFTRCAKFRIPSKMSHEFRMAYEVFIGPFDSFPIGGSTDSCPLNGPQQ